MPEFEPRILVNYPCPVCEGTGEQLRADLQLTGRKEMLSCIACINSPGFHKTEYVPLSKLAELLGAAD